MVKKEKQELGYVDVWSYHDVILIAWNSPRKTDMRLFQLLQVIDPSLPLNRLQPSSPSSQTCDNQCPECMA